MRWEDQGTASEGRHYVIPRTLCFIIHANQVLLLRGAPHKRLWPGKLNGIGGHLETGETPYDGAKREIREESGLEVTELSLRGILHVASDRDQFGIMIFVYLGTAPTNRVRASSEGCLEWHPLDALPAAEMVADLSELIPRILGAEPNQIVYGLYQPSPDGGMTYSFTYH